MKHGRLPWLRPADLDPAQRELYDRIAGGPRAQGRQAFPLADDEGRLNGPFNAMLFSPAIGSALQEVGSAIRYRGALSARAREIAILEVSVARHCEFEWYAHERVGAASGLTGEELQALRDGQPAPSFDAGERIVRAVARACIAERGLSDELFAAAEAELRTSVVAELVALVGYYDALALMLAVWRVPLPNGAEPVFTTPSQG